MENPRDCCRRNFSVWWIRERIVACSFMCCWALLCLSTKGWYLVSFEVVSGLPNDYGAVSWRVLALKLSRPLSRLWCSVRLASGTQIKLLFRSTILRVPRRWSSESLIILIILIPRCTLCFLRYLFTMQQELLFIFSKVARQFRNLQCMNCLRLSIGLVCWRVWANAYLSSGVVCARLAIEA